MRRIKNLIRRILPAYSIPWLLTAFLFNCFTYFGTRLFTTQLRHYSLKMNIDNHIPFRPEFISFYILSYVFWFVGFILIARDSKEICIRFLSAELLSKFICMLCFIIYPTTIARPTIIHPDNLWLVLTSWIYQMDAPNNLFPSIHCLESWVCFRGAMHLNKTPKWYPYFALVFASLIFASTVFVKQHVVADMVGAVFIFELSLMVVSYVINQRRVPSRG